MTRKPALVLMGLLAALAGCRQDAMVGEEVDQKIDFYQSIKVMVTKDAANIYRVYAAPVAQEEGGEELFRTNARDGVALDWADKRILKLTITCGKVIRFKNVFDINDERGLLQRMTVRLEAEGPVNCM
jgi:hypothetical protein